MHYLSNWYKQFQSETDTTRKSDGDDGEGKTPSKSNVSPDTVNDKVKRKDTPQHGTETNTTTTPRPTSLNPFRIPVNLLNFKQTQSTLVTRQAK
jgi:hypothetical protein